MALKRIIGREKEIKKLKSIISSREAQFLAVYGRRRVGKTHLIREFFSTKGLYFELTGQKDGMLKEQLENFAQIFSNIFLEESIKILPPRNWKEAFELLTKYISEVPKNKKVILFLDELPWLASPRSKLMQALDFYWNRYWSQMPNLILVTCGSAASWMLENLINAKGGLHNRITHLMLLRPFDLNETWKYLKHRKISLSVKKVCDLYLAFGGIPYYLNQVSKGKSAIQNINNLCFRPDGLLFSEFDRLFNSLFKNPENHLNIIEIMATRPQGISREELLKKMKKRTGGTLSKYIQELEAAGFIHSFSPYGYKAKHQFYRIIDEYVCFYLHWIAPLKKRGIHPGKDYWKTKSKTAGALSWMGYAFEMVCLKHVDQIQTALDIGSIACETGSWKHIPKKGEKKDGAQIDLLFDREDGVITLCEIKFSEKLFAIDKSYAKKLANKINMFEKSVLPDKEVELAMVTLHGIKPTIWSDDLIQDEVAISDLLT